ncbi:Diacylglycerol kinase [Aquimixticola soesokkakensis]|uniref:Diacylglycerol kinase n=1 Tax=Aquimixticola soesokkakensis TaxID=1519096 RepID=A0A1Y5TI12_9RHOB|nr:diacylglycerol kinase family protein [Aquimixticola soesokkakensis]SLN60814.1 Diacylglycerol kinase [Aquimixticola soesokkakensis]
MTRICVVLNAGSGRKQAQSLCESVAAAFEAQGCPAQLRLAEGAEIPKVAQQVAREGFEIVVAAGGDGTICAVASALSGSGGTLGILPMGTFNYFARSLDLPLDDIEAAVAVICAGAKRPLGYARVNGEVFLNNASLGTYPAILKEREAIYDKWGRSRVAAYWSVVKTLLGLRSQMRLRLVAQSAQGPISHDLATPLVFVMNNAFQLEAMGLPGKEHIAAGNLLAFVAPKVGRWGMIRIALALAVGRARNHRHFEMIAAPSLTLEETGSRKHRPRRIARDGERAMLAAPFRFELCRDDLSVMVPQTRAQDLR